MNSKTWKIFSWLTRNKTSQERVELWWLLTIEIPDRWNNLAVVKAFQQCVHWTLALVRRNKKSSEDDIPF